MRAQRFLIEGQAVLANLRGGAAQEFLGQQPDIRLRARATAAD